MQVHKLDEDELYHTVPGFESDIPLHNPPRTASETTYATYAQVPTFRWGNYPHVHEIDYRTAMIEDVYGKMVPAPPNYPTLDGLSFEEWDKKHTKPVPEKVQVECRGEFVVGYVCTECDRARYGQQCICGSSNSVPIVLKRPK